jgi:GWxTD domain-containing protein
VLAKLTAALLALMAAMPVCALSQEDMPSQTMRIIDTPHSYMEALNFSLEKADTTRIDVYVKVPNQVLSFTKSDELFQSVYEGTLDVDDSTGVLVAERLWTDTVTTKTYEESVSGHVGKMSQRSFFLRPGSYMLSLQVRDVDTKKVFHLNGKMNVRNFPLAAFGMSDLMLVSKVDEEGGKTFITPELSGVLGEVPEGFKVFFEAYNPLAADTAQFIITVKSEQDTVVERDTVKKFLAKPQTPCFITVHSGKYSAGNYSVAIVGRLRQHGAVPEGADTSAEVVRPFAIRWRGMPTPITDIDKAIEEMQYIADKSVIEEMQKAEPQSRRKMFEDFWKKKDPTPTTDYNELMDEYYARVEYSNKMFKHFSDGWKTDRGMVYIIFGPPSSVERRPFDIDSKPYEVWTYYEINREFVFIDQSGFGDYRLQNPIWDTWDTRYK